MPLYLYLRFSVLVPISCVNYYLQNSQISYQFIVFKDLSFIKGCRDQWFTDIIIILT